MRERRVLVVNAGSATLKATVLDMPSTDPIFDQTVGWSSDGTEAAVGQAIDDALAAMADAGIAVESVHAVGHRVVHGGERFPAPTLIDEAALVALDEAAGLAPIHDPIAIMAIRAARARLPVLHVAAFDTAFHATLPEAAVRYPVPDSWGTEHGIRRFGFHGLSVAWSTRAAATALDRPVDELRLVVAHLGGGCSVTAVDAGRSVDTSMGLTPLEGLMMGTRSGSIDPGIVFRLIRAGLPPDEIERALDHESGLRGVGGTQDMRHLLAREARGEDPARLAIEMFVRRAAAAIAAASTTLDRLDALVFTGGIGEHATSIRARICARLRSVGVPEPPATETGEGVTARGKEGLAVVVVHAREDVVIAEAALELVGR
jgi:acetate kinase